MPGGQGPWRKVHVPRRRRRPPTLYVSNEAQAGSTSPGGEFRYLEDGAVRSFYWVDGAFAYAITAGRDRADRRVLSDVAHEVYRQLTQPAAAPAAPAVSSYPGARRPHQPARRGATTSTVGKAIAQAVSQTAPTG